ncbi:MAG: cytochrome c3 family protein [Thermoguttaceae bacterium]
MPPSGVCPPFSLRDEQGNVINPVAGNNADRPYSPKQTCGACHDYEKITRGFHFTQGQGEPPTPEQAARCLWASTPGNFGGNWCSPAPLYRYLSPKKNSSAATMDMTAFSFFTSPCGTCHPGGGSAEYDRDGKRYDHWMSDPKSGFTSKGQNNFDGDYYQARWSETGVLEADCLLCHMPGYDYEGRRQQIKAWNFRWAATAGSKFAAVKGSIQQGEPVEVVYHKERFNPDGTLEPQIVREPRNEACLSCHAQPGWKKRGANFSPRTDVHLRAGLKCVDCHPAGSSATDPRIAGKEEHQIGKGDDPGGLVRNDLDNTMLTCMDCHDTGKLGAPVARHRWLPPLHLEAIACQTCHIPERLVMPIEVQASDVFNTAPKIDLPGKRLWTFYGPDWQFRNHYGYLHMMGYDDKPTQRFRPKLVRYKGKIYPANQIHSAWPGIEIEGQTALMQPRMGDIVKMWTSHRADPAAKYPELAKIVDDNGDGVPEVNRPEEIDALIHSVTQMLADIQYPMDGKRVVWVMDDRVYRSGAEFRTLPKREWETAVFANVHKYSHDILPAKAALGSGGCTDCHSPGSEFFFAPALVYRFDQNGQPVVEPQYRRLGLSGNIVAITACGQVYVKPGLYTLMLLFPCALVALVGGFAVQWVFGKRRVPAGVLWIPLAVGAAAVLGVLLLLYQPDLMEYMLPTRMWLDANHFAAAVGVMLVGLVALLWELRQWISDRGQRRSALGIVVALVLALTFGLAVVAGVLIFLKIPALDAATRTAYTVFDVAITLLLAASIVTVLRGVCHQLRAGASGAAAAE